jgi:uncharacterized membrane protein YphA (DoxX/SURF4 family)
MNLNLVEMLMVALILATVLMSVIFIIHQTQGKSFITSFDKAIIWGSGFFALESCLSTVVYLA